MRPIFVTFVSADTKPLPGWGAEYQTVAAWAITLAQPAQEIRSTCKKFDF